MLNTINRIPNNYPIRSTGFKATGEKFRPGDEPALTQYLNEIGEFSPLSREKEQDLLKKAKKGNEQARNKLVTANLKFVVSVSKSYRDQGLSLSELISEGNMGLFKAIEKYDPEKRNKKGEPIKFISYAVRWIKRYIQEALAKKNDAKFNKVQLANQIGQVEGELAQKNKRKPTIYELVDGLNKHYPLPKANKEQEQKPKKAIYSRVTGEKLENKWTLRKIEKILAEVSPLGSIDSPLNDIGTTLADILPANPGEHTHGEEILRKITVKPVMDKVKQLPKETDRIIIIKLHDLDEKGKKSLREVADIVSELDTPVTHETVRKRKNDILKNWHSDMRKEKTLDEYKPEAVFA